MELPFEIKKNRVRDTTGKFVSSDPLVQVTVSNPISSFQKWFTKLISNEGIDLRIRVRPLTALLIGIIVTAGGFGFGLGRFTVPESSPIVQYIPQLAQPPTPTPHVWKDTAFAGMLRYSSVTEKYYLETNQAEAITLEVPVTVDLSVYVGRRIFAAGSMNVRTGILFVTDATDLELLPVNISPIPTVAISDTPVPT